MAVTQRGIWTPDSGDDYALTTDLAAMADTIDDALEEVTPIARESGSNEGANSGGVLAPGQSAALTTFAIPSALPVGSVLQIYGALEVFLPASVSGKAGYVRVNGPNGTIAQRRWNSHGRTTQFFYPSINANHVVTSAYPAGSTFQLVLTSDSSSGDNVEYWYAYSSWLKI